MYLETEKGFLITHFGDESVGIPNSHFELQGYFGFETEEEYNMFVKKMKEAFEYQCPDPVRIETLDSIEERERKLEAELEMYTKN